MIPLFDSLAHPDLEGREIGVCLQEIQKKMKLNGFRWASIVETPHLDPGQRRFFIRSCQRFPHFVPIASIDPKQTVKSWTKKISHLAKQGFKGIKIHPRSSGISWDYPSLPSILRSAQKKGLVSLLCTYSHFAIEDYPREDPFYALVRLLKKVPASRILLLHGGDVRLLQYAELVRPNPQLLLDLSFTLLKYPGSSLELDIQFLFRYFDRRICIGTDYPEFSHADGRRRFEQFSKGLSRSKKENIGFRNLRTFFRI